MATESPPLKVKLHSAQRDFLKSDALYRAFAPIGPKDAERFPLERLDLDPNGPASGAQ